MKQYDFDNIFHFIILILYEAILPSFVIKDYRALGYVGFAHPQTSREFEQKILERRPNAASTKREAPSKAPKKDHGPAPPGSWSLYSVNVKILQMDRRKSK